MPEEAHIAEAAKRLEEMILALAEVGKNTNIVVENK